MMGKPHKVYTILLTLQFLCVLPLLAIVDLYGVIISGNYGKLSSIVEIE
jgi:hypothetical protein